MTDSAFCGRHHDDDTWQGTADDKGLLQYRLYGRHPIPCRVGWRCALRKGTDHSSTAIATSYIPTASHRPHLCFSHVQWRLKLLPLTEPQKACRNLQHPCRTPTDARDASAAIHDPEAEVS